MSGQLMEGRKCMRVMVADDSLLFREGLARLLTERGFDVIGLACDGAWLTSLVRRDPPDVVVVDIRMPPTHTAEGIEVARELRAGHPELGVLVLSQYVETHYAAELFDEMGAADGGGRGYLLKDRVSRLDDLVAGVRRVGEGGLVVDPALVDALMRRRRTRDPVEELTDRERQVLALMAEGRTNTAIAKTMNVTVKTVEAHVRNIFDRLGLALTEDDNRRVLAVLAFLRR
ncbi:response regulator transcription factor [Nonomuraea sp. NPDC046802]|uniref:response regulator transcription factor n=1 Tax=Nonomuraea sp. NPDC046802 TaxID=3154919 RepID=UPI0033F38ABC